ncbi:hypothetical protein BOTBODRAFT_185344 [Botryobasidium botryosum FD-172 SS1]|uniref:SET domain-containing protein n=1 Tax=Botryobasidium botryosum (strain FD-172 SS1) TaxID=930990 RepID=A0A067N2F0_BOTB1|nr:hypothetical protein BOTBODRAFT_185344 [Botryobasidium botryosum FD-172 SS1]
MTAASPLPLEFLQRCEVLLRKDAENRKLGPGPSPPFVDGHSLKETALRSRRNFDEQYGEYTHQSSSHVGYRQHHSTFPLQQLKRIAYYDMKVRKTHLGRYLLCATVVPASRAVGIMVCVEDPEGATFQLSIYNFPGTIATPGIVLDTIFPVGSILAVREPTMIVGTDPRDISIRIDSPSDLIFLRPTDTLLRTIKWKNSSRSNGPATRHFDTWKDVGDVHINSRHYLAAAVAYTRALESAPNGFNGYHYWLFRAVAYYRFRHYTAALADATFLSNMPRIPIELQGKAARVAAQCEYSLARYEAAISTFERSRSRDPSGAEEVSNWLKKCRRRIEESRGVYDWASLFVDTKNSGERLDVADYVGPMKVVSMPHRGGGRGVVTTRAVKAGELILVAKPVVSSFPADYRSQHYTYGLNFITREPESPCASDAMSQLIATVAGNPELAPLIYGLYAGPMYPDPPPEYPPAPLADITDRHPLVYEVDIDTEKLQNIYTYNAFVPRPIHLFTNADPNNPPSALYLLPSLFNHACAATANWYNFREVMVIRAIRDLEKGEELTIAYVQGRTAWDRQAALKKHEFTCNCSLCVADRKDGETACGQRSELVEKGNKYSPTTQPTPIVTVRKHLCEVEGTYAPSRGTIRPAASGARQRLARAYEMFMTKKNELVFTVQVISMDIAALEGLGLTVLDKSVAGPININIAHPTGNLDNDIPIDVQGSALLSTEGDLYIKIILQIAHAFQSLSDGDRENRWLQASLRIHDLFYGGSMTLYRTRHMQADGSLVKV